MTGQTALKSQEAAPEWRFGPGLQCHTHSRLPAAQDRAQGDYHKLVEVVPKCIAGTGVSQVGETGDEAFRWDLLGMANPQG